MKEGEIVIDMGRMFSPYPAGRVENDGPHNGARFRDEFLLPALTSAMEGRAARRVVVDLDGCRVFGSTFLEEAFGGLARVPGFPFDEAVDHLEIRYSKPYLKLYHDAVKDYLTGDYPQEFFMSLWSHG